MQQRECIIVLGAQIGLNEKGEMDLAPHTKMRAHAAGMANQHGAAKSFILSGGYNIGVRYDLHLSVPVFGTEKSDRKPDYSQEAKNRARQWRSEASLIGEIMRKEYKVPPQKLIFEEDSATTQENAQRCARIIREMDYTKVGILTQLYHMKRSLTEFRTELTAISTVPIFAEELLFSDRLSDDTWLQGKDWLFEICSYYAVPKGGKQYNPDRIRQLLMEGKSLAEMLG